MTKNNTYVLFTLGEDEARKKDWPDYLALGITQTDVPTLLNYITDDTLINADDDSENIWVPLHAWRALGQLKATEAAEPLIALFDNMVDDDWAFSEVPSVLGMIGEASIAPLTACLNNEQLKEFARIMGMDGLAEIAIRHPHLRNEILRHYQTYLRQPDLSMLGLNGLLIARLLDLEAKELIDDIRDCFAKNCIDISCAGDLEDIEIEFGLREKRSTPRAPFVDYIEPPTLSRPKNDDDLFEMLGYYLIRYGCDESILAISELDGFFAAINCSPTLITPSVWVQAIWGGEEFCPDWEDKKELEDFMEKLFSFYSHGLDCMNHEKYNTLFLHRKVNGKPYLIVDEWCEGFLKAINLWEPLNAADQRTLNTALEPINLFATEEGHERLESLSKTEMETYQKKIKPNVMALFQCFNQQQEISQAQSPVPIVNNTIKLKRNAPCPCGSGKKYKKCCLH